MSLLTVLEPDDGNRLSAAAAQPIETPCVKVCVLDPASGLCTGCRRSLREIAAWGSMPPEMRARIMSELPGRAAGTAGA
ncbi:DUF1289 domain-containing protein [uncultured Caulobacter sp.]|uniref:DUF1289 domain-containing protein n=1 Tax=uncultured Caulobacter sp. TaxID=158749 RepID=UPI00261DAE45|nr:DUF1289 domain-containing protein [uncultured Caulobacter sp.]